METNTTAAPAMDHSHNQNHPKNNNNDHNHHRVILSSISILIIIIVIISIIILLAIFLIIVMLRRLHSSKNNHGENTKPVSRVNDTNCKFTSHSIINFTDSPDVKGGCLHGGNLTRIPTSRFRGVQVFTYRDLEIATGGFSEANVIGYEEFGVVYKGVLNDGTVAAIKVLHREGKQMERAFRIEVDLLSRLQSPYLVELLGYCADQHHRLLIYEFMPNDTLQHHLHPSSNNNKHLPLDWETRLRIAFDCARALEFLHENSVPSIIHRDFKSSNVLLDHNFRARVSDFGLAKMGSDKLDGQISTRVLGTTGYLAPEYASTGKLTTKSDVYSYGVVLLELLTGRVPIDSRRPTGEHVLVSWALPRLTNREKLAEMVDPALQGQYSKKDLIQVAAIAAVCVQPEADYRPLMTDVAQSLIPLVKNLSCMSTPGSSRHLVPTNTEALEELSHLVLKTVPKIIQLNLRQHEVEDPSTNPYLVGILNNQPSETAFDFQPGIYDVIYLCKKNLVY